MAGYYEKTPSGKYRLFASGGVGPDGKRKRYTKTISAKSDRAVEKELAKFVAEVEKGEYIEPSKSTFEKFVERWIKQKNLSPKTLFRYKEIMESRILPALGHLKIEKITPVHLLDFYANLQEDGIRKDGKPGGLSAKTIRQHHAIISSILNDAVQWQLIPSNPAARVQPPKIENKPAACYDEEQVTVMLDALESEELKYQVLIQLALFTGLRRGELMGLEWNDINFEKNTIEVRQVSQYLPNTGLFTKSPKNESSERLIALPASIMIVLKQHKAHQAEERLKVGDLWRGAIVLSNFTELFNAVTPKEVSGIQLIKSLRCQSGINEEWEKNIQVIADRVDNEEFMQELYKFGVNAAPEIAALSTLSDEQLQEFISLWQEKSKNSREGRVFTTWDGQPMHPDTITSWFPKFLRRHGLPHMSFHGVRHTAATMLINQGLPAKSISGRLGHSNIGTTFNIYGHYLKSADKEAADRLEKVYQNMKEKGKMDTKKGQA